VSAWAFVLRPIPNGSSSRFASTSCCQHELLVVPLTCHSALRQLGLFISLQRPGPISIGDMYLLLLEVPAHFCSQFVEKLPDGAVIKVAGILRENLSGKNGDRLTMTGGVTSGIGIEDFAAGEHPGQKWRTEILRFR
jgi:hypothetical protein